jgi:hypothetical protein
MRYEGKYLPEDSSDAASVASLNGTLGESDKTTKTILYAEKKRRLGGRLN